LSVFLAAWPVRSQSISYARHYENFSRCALEIREVMLRLANVPPPDPTWRVPTYGEEAIERLLRPSREAEVTLRSLGSRIIAFGDTEWIAAEIVRYLGFDPQQAGYGLIALSNSLAQIRRSARSASSVDQQSTSISRVTSRCDRPPPIMPVLERLATWPGAKSFDRAHDPSHRRGDVRDHGEYGVTAVGRFSRPVTANYAARRERWHRHGVG
jgi:hypothetical protein